MFDGSLPESADSEPYGGRLRRRCCPAHVRCYIFMSLPLWQMLFYFYTCVQAINSEIFVGYENQLYVKIVLRNSPYIFNIQFFFNNFNPLNPLHLNLNIPVP